MALTFDLDDPRGYGWIWGYFNAKKNFNHNNSWLFWNLCYTFEKHGTKLQKFHKILKQGIEKRCISSLKKVTQNLSKTNFWIGCPKLSLDQPVDLPKTNFLESKSWFLTLKSCFLTPKNCFFGNWFIWKWFLGIQSKSWFWTGFGLLFSTKRCTFTKILQNFKTGYKRISTRFPSPAKGWEVPPIPSFEMSKSRQENSQSIQTLLSGKQPLNSPSRFYLSAYSFKNFTKF